MYTFYINGNNIEKRFGREFINHICGGNIMKDIRIDECTRKKIVLDSSYAADKLRRVSHRVFWPDGTLFKCKLVKSVVPNIRRPSLSPYRSDEDWYASASFVDVDLEEFDDDTNNKKLYN
jgi:hypothetical protein